MKDIMASMIVSIGGLIGLVFLISRWELSNPIHVGMMAVGLFWFSYVIYASIQQISIRKRIKKLEEK